MLNGRTALIVEQEFLIALDLQRMLEDLGAGQTLFARTPEEAAQLRTRWPEVAIALVEARTDSDTHQFLAELQQAGIPIVLTTADLAVPHQFAHLPGLPVVIKPIPEDAVASAIKQVLGRG